MLCIPPPLRLVNSPLGAMWPPVENHCSKPINSIIGLFLFRLHIQTKFYFTMAIIDSRNQHNPHKGSPRFLPVSLIFMSGFHHGRNLYTTVETFTPQRKRFHHGEKVYTTVKTFSPRWKCFHCGTNLYTVVETFSLRWKGFHVGVNV